MWFKTDHLDSHAAIAIANLDIDGFKNVRLLDMPYMLERAIFFK
jgi:hypothetical protein